MTTDLVWKTEQRKIKDLIPMEDNPRALSDKERADLTESLTKFNLVSIPAINTDGRIISGHQRMAIMTRLGKAEEVIDVRVPNRPLTKEEAWELNIRENKNTGHFAWDLLKLHNPEDLLQYGFSQNELEHNLKITMDKHKAEEGDELKPDETPRALPGNVYTLGRHRVMCGDSTNMEHLKQLMAGAKADMVFTDPPYNINYEGQGENTSTTIENDNMATEDFREFLKKAFACMREGVKPTAPIYVCYASSTHRDFEDALEANNFFVKNQIVWVKPAATMTWGDYRWKHELIFYAGQDGQKIPFYGDRARTTEWKTEPTDDELLRWARRRIAAEEKDGKTTIWRFQRDKDYEHPTQKPVKLIHMALRNSSERKSTVLDLFGGGGSTLIACEQKDRTCYSMELDPRFVDVMIRRYCRYAKADQEQIFTDAVCIPNGAVTA